MAEATIGKSGPDVVNVGDGREGSTIAEPDDRQVKHVGAQAVGEQVPDGVAGQSVRTGGSTGCAQ
jgi:hypothetical protein